MVENQGKARKKKKQNLSMIMTFVLMAFILGITAWMFVPEEQPKKNKHVPTTTPKIELQDIKTEEEVLAVVLEKDTSTGEERIISQSWTWRNGNRLCFDNIETISGNSKEIDEVIRAVREIAEGR